MATNAGRTALVTGASSGIGEALARCFAGGGFDLVLVARSAAKLQALAAELQAAHSVAVRVLPADLAAPGAAAALHAALRRRRVAVDVLVNNAGVLEHGAFTDIAASRHQQLIDLNIGALTAMLAQFVPDMRERGWGRVLNVASLAAFQPVPTLATYAATKAYVLSLSEALAVELGGSGVSVTALCPGFTDTPMIGAGPPGSGKLPQLPAVLVGHAADVAAAGYRACLRGEVVCVPGAINRAGSLASRVLPRRLVRGMGRALAKTQR
ncbi:MAG TPA: SDR family NAD(P)-dependent oxidoreductase [Rubrivivax sp.]|nr:SDR family NAD(P)-dependent oxidoreductase [Rubrivivax sp.]HPO18386.1 SDR family NAD(P)-dependent oxidoreductase [Rubrivivax sp.]